jgi:hypothetical protein
VAIVAEVLYRPAISNSSICTGCLSLVLAADAMNQRIWFFSGPPKREGGQALVFALFASIVVILALFTMFSMGMQSIEKIRLQNTADAAAYSAAVAEARDYNFAAYTNRAMIANQVAVAQFVGLTSWMRNMSHFANGDSSNWGYDLYQILFDFGEPTAVKEAYQTFLHTLGSATQTFDGGAGSDFMSAAVSTLDGLINVYAESQKIYHYSTALSVAQTLGVFSSLADQLDTLIHTNWFASASTWLSDNGVNLDSGDIIHANDQYAELTAAGLPYLAYHYDQWFKFTEFKDPNTMGMDGLAADRFAQVTMDSLDDFSRDRSTKPSWGYNSMYAPPITFVDPEVFIPFTDGPLFFPVIHRGGTELKLTDESGSSNVIPPAVDPPGQGVDCNGNSISVGNTEAISVDSFSKLPLNSSPPLCDGTQGIVTPTGSGSGGGVYVYQQGVWVSSSALSGQTGVSPPPANGNRGTEGSVSKKSWTALDASSWSGIDILWISILFVPVPLPVPFAPPWLPLSYGAAQSGKQLSSPTVLAAGNNFGVGSSDAYGGVLDSWTTKIAANMQSQKGAGTSLDVSPGSGGLIKYLDVKNVSVDDLAGPPLVIEIEKSINNMVGNPGSGRLGTDNGAPQKKMRSLSKSQAYFSRPSRADGKVELGSLYNPYWQARLLPNNFVEQYLSMELHLHGNGI